LRRYFIFNKKKYRIVRLWAFRKRLFFENILAPPYTISKVEVTDVIKGNVEIGDILEVKQLGDFEKMPEAFLAETDGYFNKDDSELLFLASFESTPYSPLNPTQGAVKVLEDQTLYSASKYSLFGYEAKTRSTPQTLDDAIAEISKYVQYQGAIGK